MTINEHLEAYLTHEELHFLGRTLTIPDDGIVRLEDLEDAVRRMGWQLTCAGILLDGVVSHKYTGAGPTITITAWNHDRLEALWSILTDILHIELKAREAATA